MPRNPDLIVLSTKIHINLKHRADEYAAKYKITLSKLTELALEAYLSQNEETISEQLERLDKKIDKFISENRGETKPASRRPTHCPNCGTTSFHRKGTQRGKDGGHYYRWRCNQCYYNWLEIAAP